jgi:hypothetical protein
MSEEGYSTILGMLALPLKSRPDACAHSSPLRPSPSFSGISLLVAAKKPRRLNLNLSR